MPTSSNLFSRIRVLETGWLILLSAVLLRLSRPGIDLWPLAWIGFVPLLWAVRHKSPLESFIIASLSLWIGNFSGFFWVHYLAREFMGIAFPFNYLFLVLYSLYLGVATGVVFFCYRFLVIHTALPGFLLFPITFTSIWHLYPLIFEHSFAETQITMPYALQGMDVTGALGLNFMIFLSNALILSLISRSWVRNKISFALGILLLVSWFGYGAWQYPTWQKKVASWPETTFGIVQPNRPAGFSSSLVEEGYSQVYPWEMAQTIALVEKDQARFVIWPEGNHYRYPTNREVKKSFQKYAADLRVNLIFAELYPKVRQSGVDWYNAMLWIRDNGQEETPYFKRILVPFGEYIPGAKFLAPIIGTFSEFLPSLKAGDKFQYFKDDNGTIIPVICYESLFSYYIAEAANLDAAKRLILVVSQDGWYDSKLQVYEHSYITMLRAVENRIPLLHVVQNGFSSLILPSGDSQLISDYNKREAKAINIPLDSTNNKSFFSRHPYWFVTTVRTIFISLLALALFNFLKKSRRRAKSLE